MLWALWYETSMCCFPHICLPVAQAVCVSSAAHGGFDPADAQTHAALFSPRLNANILAHLSLPSRFIKSQMNMETRQLLVKEVVPG